MCDNILKHILINWVNVIFSSNFDSYSLCEFKKKNKKYYAKGQQTVF